MCLKNSVFVKEQIDAIYVIVKNGLNYLKI